MEKLRTVINDSWVLSRTGHFSNSFSNFLSLALKIPDKEGKKVQRDLERASRQMEKATKTIESLDELKAPIWVKPFVSKIMQQVSQSARAPF